MPEQGQAHGTHPSRKAHAPAQDEVPSPTSLHATFGFALNGDNLARLVPSTDIIVLNSGPQVALRNNGCTARKYNTANHAGVVSLNLAPATIEGEGNLPLAPGGGLTNA